MNSKKNVKTYAGWLKDTAMLAKLGDLDFVAKEIHYNGICGTKYKTKAEQTQPKKQKTLSRTWRHSRDVHAGSFKSICNMIETQVIREKETVLMSEIANNYNSLLIENTKAGSVIPISTTQSIEGKLLQHFKDRILIHKGKTRKGHLLFRQKITLEEALMI